MLGCSAVALLACAAAPTFGALLAAITLLGLATVAGQIVAPLAGDLADDADRGRVVGVVISGMLTGILVSRTVSGLVAAAAGWRVIYLGAAVAALILAVLLHRGLPTLPARARVRYPALLASIGTVIQAENGRCGGRWSSAPCSSERSPCPYRLARSLPSATQAGSSTSEQTPASTRDRDDRWSAPATWRRNRFPAARTA